MRSAAIGMIVAMGVRHPAALLPERLARSLAAVLGGVVHETATLLLPPPRAAVAPVRGDGEEPVADHGRARRRRRASAAGHRRGRAGSRPARDPEGRRERRRAGLDRGVRFSPLWLLAAAADVSHGSRTYLDAFVSELRAASVLGRDTGVETLDDVLGALEGVTGTSARLIDVPPLEVEALSRSLADLRRDASGLPSPRELARALDGLRRTARLEGRSLLEVSVGVGPRLLQLRASRRPASTCSIRTATTSARCGARASAPMRPASPARTRRRSPDISTPESRTLTERGLERLSPDV